MKKTTRADLLKLLTVRTETIKLDCLKNTNMKNMEFQLKEMTINQNKKYSEILKDANKKGGFDECIKYACKSVMIEPTFFTDKELENLNTLGKVIMDEIFYKIPTIGMTESEKDDYKKRVIENAKKITEKSDKKDEVSEEKK